MRDVSYHKLYLNFSLLFFFSVFLNTKDALGSSEKNTFVIDDQTKISFSIPEEIFYYANVIDDSIKHSRVKKYKFLTLF